MRPERVEPGPGQESVWDYPRPPRVEPTKRRIRVQFAGEVVAESDRAVRVLETYGAPCFYVPAEDVRTEFLRPAAGATLCEWKGSASYFDVAVGDQVAPAAAWSYSQPNSDYLEIAGYISFYPGQVDAYLDGERARPQPGGYYGGWITDDVVGPFKGERGTEGW